MRNFQLVIKRLFDIVVSLILILILTVIPVFIVVPILIKLTSKGPAVFVQERMGKCQKVFNIYKFRTMRLPPEGTYSVGGKLYGPDGNLLPPSSERITKIGNILRKTSLDELMQLFNILNGTMSFVGPRPTLPYQAENYSDEQKRRFQVRPGVTGWAQVNGRNNLTWTEKLAYDVEYVDKFSLWLDIKVLFKTVAVVLKREEIEFKKEDTITQKEAVNKKKAIVLAGGCAQIELLKQLRERGIETVLLDGNPNAVAVPFADKFIKAQIMDSDEVKEITVKEKADMVITVCADQVLLISAKVSEELGLPCYIDYQTAVNVSDKTYMKKIFWENNIPTSRYVETDELDLEQVKELKYPLVVKPVDAYSSKGVRKVDNEEELRVCFAEAKEISRNGGVIVEEFKAGEEISVDVFVTDGKAQLLCVSNSEKIADKDRFIIFRGRYPVNASKQVLDLIQKTAQQIADAFGIKNAPMLIQMITDGENVSVLEFCARTGGNMKYLLIKHSCGVDVIGAVIDLTLGIKPEIKVSEPESKYVVNDFIYCKEGIFDRIEGFEEMLEAGNITDYKVLRPRGMKVQGVRSSSDRIAGVTLQADSLEEFNKKHRAFVEGVKILDTDGNDIMRHDLLTELK